jgi:thiol-disulfide isomerase/thioredoxin
MKYFNLNPYNMQRFFLVSGIFLLLIACNKPSSDEPSQQLILGAKSYLKINLINVSDTLSFFYWYNETLPNDQYTKSLNAFSDTTLMEKLRVSQPTTINFIHNNSALRFFVLPNDTLEVFLDFQNEGDTKDIVSYKGITGSICDYLNNGKYFFWNNHPEKDEAPNLYNQRIDSLRSVAYDRFIEYQENHSLPDWFVKHEKSDIFFKGELLKLSQYSQHFWMYHQYIPKEERLTEQIKEELKNLTWITDEPITNFIVHVRPAIYDTLLRPEYITDDILFEFSHDNISELREVLPENLLSVIVASRVSDRLYKGNLQKLSSKELEAYSLRVDSFLDANAALISDTAIRRFIYDYKDRQCQMVKNNKKLLPGAQAPDFYLESLDGSSIKLSQYKGKTVLLNFWGIWCIPCINSIPSKNQLLKTFGKEGLVMVSVCTDGNFKKWREIISTEKYEGTHLICKGNWNSLLGEKYNIEYIPHYTLINKDGLVIKNVIHRDSLEHYIKASL